MWHGNSNIISGTELKKADFRCSAQSKLMEKKKPLQMDSYHVLYKVPVGDSPYVRAKHVQLVDKDPSKAISLFWSAINTGDRVDSALKDMAIVMKQVNRSEEAVEAIKSFRHLCSYQAQESLDNVLLDLYKKCGRIEDQIELLQYKLKIIEEGQAFCGRRTKIARSQGKKFLVSIDQEKSRLLGNLAWAYVQKDNYQSAEALYRKALSIEPDKNKQCNLAICLLKTGRTAEARFLLQGIGTSALEKNPTDSYIKSYERACEMLVEIESQSVPNANKDGKQAGVVEELNTIRPNESPVPARNSCITASPSPRDSLLPSVNGNMNRILEMSATDSRIWEDYTDKKWAAVNLNSNRQYVSSPLTVENSTVKSLGKQSVGSSKAKSPSVEGNWKWGLVTSIAGNETLINMVEEDKGIPTDSPFLVGQWLKGYSKDSDDHRTSVTWNSRMTQGPIVLNNGKKTWEDAIEDEETSETLASDLNSLVDETSELSISFGTSSKWSESWDEGDAFPDDNSNTTIIRCTPRQLVGSPYYTDTIQQHKLETVNLMKGPLETPPYSTPSSDSDAVYHKNDLNSSTPFSTGFEWKPSARRALSFVNQEGSAADCTATLPNTFPDENYNTNIIRCTPRQLVRSPYYTDHIRQQKLKNVNLKGPLGTPPYSTPSSDSDAVDHKNGLNSSTPCSTGFKWKASTRRALSFGNQGPATDCTTTLPNTVDIGDSSYLQATGTGSNFGMAMKPKRQGNRLRVFQEITLPDSPRA